MFITVLFSCNYNKTGEFVINENYYLPIKFDDIALLINGVISNALLHFSDSINYNICTFFIDDLENEDVVKNLSRIKGQDSKGRDTTIVYNKNELNQFIKDYEYLKGTSITPFISEYYKSYVSDDDLERIIFIAPPWVDRKNSIVCIWCSIAYRNENNGYSADNNRFFIYKFESDVDEWYLFNVIEFKYSSTLEILRTVFGDDYVEKEPWRYFN